MSATASLVLTFDTSWLNANFNNVVPPIADLVENGGGVQVDRGDGIPVSYNPEDVITLTGTTLIITGDFRTFGYGSIWPGAVGLTSFELNNLGSITNLNGACYGSVTLTSITGFAEADVSQVTDMSNMFRGATGLYTEIGAFRFDLTAWPGTAAHTLFLSPDGFQDTSETDDKSPFYLGTSISLNFATSPTLSTHWTNTLPYFPNTVITVTLIGQGGGGGVENNIAVSYGGSGAGVKFSYTVKTGIPVGELTIHTGTGGGTAGTAAQDSVDENGNPITIPGVQPGSGEASFITIKDGNDTYQITANGGSALTTPNDNAGGTVSVTLNGEPDNTGITFIVGPTAGSNGTIEGSGVNGYTSAGGVGLSTYGIGGGQGSAGSPGYASLDLSLPITLPISDITSSAVVVNFGAEQLRFTAGQDISGVTTGFVQIYGDFTTFGLGNVAWENVVYITGFTWGINTPPNLNGAFNGATQLTSVPTTLPSSVTSMSYMFSGCTAFTGGNGALTNWDVSTVVDMSYMFVGSGLTETAGFSTWTPSSATTLDRMFSGATALYNQDGSFKVDLTGWETSITGTPTYTYFLSPTGSNDTTESDIKSPFYVEPPPPPPPQTLTQTMNLTFAANTAVTLPISGIDANGLSIDWNDGNGYTPYATGATVSGTTGETGVVDISGNFATFGLGDQQWTGVTSLSEVNVFVLTGVTSLAGAFNGATSFVGSTINTWDVSTVTNVDYMFSGATALYDANGFMIDLTGWTPTITGTPVQFFSPDGTAENDTTTTDTKSPFYSSTPPPPPTSSLSLTFDEAWLIAHEYKVTPPIHGLNGEVLVDLGGGDGSVPYTEGTELTMAGVTLAISGNFTTFGNGDNSWPGAAGLVSCIATSIASITNLSGAFNGCEQFTDVNPDYSLDIWTVTQVTDMSHMFRGCVAFNNTNLGNWERTGLNPSTVQFVTSMKSMFALCNAFVGTSIDAWNVSNVTDFSGMFHSNDVFNNTNLGNWSLKLNSSGLGEINMSQMFYNALVFEGTSIENWNMGNTVNTSEMFAGAYQFNNTLLGSWETWERGSTMFYVNTMHHMFYDTRVFTGGNIDLWNVSMCTDFGRMFEGALIFNNTNLGNWERPAPDNGGGGPTPGGQSTLNFAGLNTNTANVNMYSMFKGAAAFEGTTMGQWSVSSVTNMSRMFEGATAFTADLGGWNQQQSSGEGLFNIKDMSHMFDGATSFTGTNIQTWNPRDVTDMSYMFRGATSFNNMSLGFWSASGSTTENVTSMAYMFAGCTAFTDATQAALGVDGWNVKAVKDMSHMFDGATVFNNTNLGIWNRSDNDTGNLISYMTTVTSMAGMFKNAKAFTGTTIENWNLYNIGDVSDMFNGATIFNNALLGTWQQTTPIAGFSQSIYKINMARMFMDASGFTGGTIGAWYMRDVTDVSDMFNGAVLFNADLTGWSTEGFGSGVNSPPINMSGMFKGATSFVGNGVDTWQVGYTNDFSNMFNGATAFANELLGNWSSTGSGEIGENVTTITMTGMFRGATSFTGIGANSAPGIETWNVSKVTDMSYMFAGATAFANEGLTNWGSISSTAAVKNLSHMFDGATVYTDDSTSGIETWDVSSVSDMSYMFANTGAYNNSNLGGWNTVSVQNMASMFKSATAFTGGNIYDWNVSAVTDMSRMFEGTTSFTTTNLGGWERAEPTSSTVAYVRNMSHMFNGSGTDGSGVNQWNVTDVTDMSYMFANIQGSFTNTGLGYWERPPNPELADYTPSTVANVRNMSHMFEYTGFVDVSGTGVDQWSPSGVTDFSYMFANSGGFDNTNLGNWTLNDTEPINMSRMFFGSSFVDAVGTGVDQWIVTQVTDMSWMFANTEFANQGLANWETQFSTMANVRNFAGIFSSLGGGAVAPNCFTDIDTWVIGATDMSSMFENNTNLLELQLSAWESNTSLYSYGTVTSTMSNVNNTSRMFNGCSNFMDTPVDTPVTGVDMWNLSSVTDMSYMFALCAAFNNVNLGYWQNAERPTTMGQVRNMSNMFANSGLVDGTINLWDVSGVTDMSSMFSGASGFLNPNLSTWNTSNVNSMASMFSGALAFPGTGIEGWVVSSVTDFSNMFNMGDTPNPAMFSPTGASNVDLTGWNVSGSTVAVPSGFFRRFFNNSTDDVTETDPGSPFWAPTTTPMTLTFVINEYTQPITLPISGITGNIVVDYGDGRKRINVLSGLPIGTVGLPTGTVTIWGTFTHFSHYDPNLTSWPGAAFLESISGWENPGITDLSGACMGTTNLTAVPTALPAGVTNLSYLFANSAFNGAGIEQWDVSTVTDMYYMFANSGVTNVSLGNWNTSMVKTMSNMFYGTAAFTGDSIDTWNVSAVTDMTNMFSAATAFNNDLGAWSTAPSSLTLVKTMAGMFSGATSFEGTGIDTWTLAVVTDMSNMFNGASVFNNSLLGAWQSETSTVNTVNNMSGMFAGATSFEGTGIDTWTLAAVTDMSDMFSGASVFNNSLLGAWQVNTVKNMSGMFSDASGFVGGNIGSWTVSSVSDMSNMFNGASVFNSELPWDTSNVVTMNGMFTDASGFVGLSGIQNWNTSQVTTMAGMFQRASTFNQKLMRATSIWDTSKVVDFSNMFNGASVYLGEDISGWDVTSATSMVGMFANTTRFDKDLSYWSLPAVTAVDGMFAKATALYDGVNFKYDLTGWADTFTGNPTHSLFFSLDGETETTTADLKSPFYLVNLPPNITLYFDPVATPQLPLFEIGVDGIDINWHDGNDPQFYPHLSPGPFVPSGNLIEYPGAAGLAKVDISGSFGKFGKGIIPWNGVMDLYRVGGSGDGSLTNLSGAFANANSFTGIGLGAWDVSGVTDMSYMFMYSGITDVNLEAWDTSKVKNMSNMFLTAEEFVGNGVNQWDTSSVTDMSNMFNGAAMFNAALATNGSKWDTQLVRNMNSMFSTAPAFTGGGIDTWDTSSVTDMTRMFYNDTSFDNVNLGNWNVSTVRNMGSMFAGSAFSGWSISSWNVSNVTNMAEMFQGCPNFEEQNAGGNIGNWERTEPTVSTLANVTSMNSMFAYSTKFKGEGISTWNVVGVTDMTSMFQNGGLTSSLVDWAFSLNGVIPTPPNFLTDGTDDLTTTSPLSPFGPAPVIPTQTNSTSLLSFASPPNPSYKLAPGSTIYGTAGTKFYSTNTSGAYSEIMDLAEYGTPIGAMIGNPTHYNATVFTITQTQAGGSLFFYDTSSGLSGTIGTFAAQPLPNSVFDSVGNLYMVDTAGALYKVTPSMNNQVSTDTLPIVAQLGTIGLTSIDISNNVLCWVQSAGTLGGLDLTSVGTPPTLTQIPGLVQTFLIDSNKVYYYDSSSNLSVYTNETATTLWDFAANPTYGTTPTGDLFIDRTEQTIYGICTGGGPGFGKGFRGGGVLYRFTISTGEMDVITSYFRDDGVTGSGPVSFTVVPDNGQSYVVTSGSAVAPRLRSPFLVNPRAAGPNYQVSQSTLPGYVTSCFNYGVKILTQVHGAEAWRPVETLREGDIVKTYKHGYRPITHIGKGVLINDAAIWHSSMFKAQMEGFEPLIVTGGHSILVDYLTQEEQQKQAVFWERGEEVIDDKLLMIAPVSPLFTQIKERKLFTYFHFSVQNDGDDDRRYGVWANGFLTETPSVNQYKLHKYHDM